jgi:hypothetical protein
LIDLAFRPRPEAGVFNIPILLVPAFDVEQDWSVRPIRVSASPALMPWRNVSNFFPVTAGIVLRLKHCRAPKRSLMGHCPVAPPIADSCGGEIGKP